MVRIGVSGVRLRNQKVMKSRTGMIQAYSLKALLKAVISTPRSNMIHGLIKALSIYRRLKGVGRCCGWGSLDIALHR